MKHQVEMSEILAQKYEQYKKKYPITYDQAKAAKAIIQCRTSVLGGHLLRCDHCSHSVIYYNSCRNRHCPKCQHTKQNQWIEKLINQLLPCRYFHVVCTVPNQLNELMYSNQRVMYDILIKAACHSIMKVAGNNQFLGAKTGALAILHTWGQNLLFHPHVHMLVPAGGLSEDGWEWVKAGKKFFVPVKALSKIFRARFMFLLKAAYNNQKIKDVQDFKSLKEVLYSIDWNVYCKKTFGGPSQVISYLGRYTHRVAISNNRIISANADKVTFRWKDYRKARTNWEIMHLNTLEFIRRFLLHVLPSNFYKIRYCGIFALSVRKNILKRCVQLITENAIAMVDCAINQVLITNLCPVCKSGHMKFVYLIDNPG